MNLDYDKVKKFYSTKFITQMYWTHCRLKKNRQKMRLFWKLMAVQITTCIFQGTIIINGFFLTKIGKQTVKHQVSLTNLNWAAVRARTAAWESRIEAMCMFCNLGQLLPKPSTRVVRSVASFSWRENSKETSLNCGQSSTYKFKSSVSIESSFWIQEISEAISSI